MRGVSCAVAIATCGLLALTGNAEPVRRGKGKAPLVEDVRTVLILKTAFISLLIHSQKPLVNSIHLKDLMKCAQNLEDIAYATSGRNRVRTLSSRPRSGRASGSALLTYEI
jgi:carboxypeptidase Q